MKLTRDKVVDLMRLLEDKINSLQEKRNKIEEDWREKMLSNKTYKKVRMLISRFETQHDNLKMKLYSDFRVYTTGERSRDSRLDCVTMRG